MWEADVARVCREVCGCAGLEDPPCPLQNGLQALRRPIGWTWVVLLCSWRGFPWASSPGRAGRRRRRSRPRLRDQRQPERERRRRRSSSIGSGSSRRGNGVRRAEGSFDSCLLGFKLPPISEAVQHPPMRARASAAAAARVAARIPVGSTRVRQQRRRWKVCWRTRSPWSVFNLLSSVAATPNTGS